jgi:hypothetical protein
MADLLSFLQGMVGKAAGPDANRVRDFGTLPGLVEPKKE